LALAEQRHHVHANLRHRRHRQHVHSALERDEFDVSTLPNGATRMYVGAGEGSTAFNPPSPPRRSGEATTLTRLQRSCPLDGAQVIDYCGGQCWYDNVVYTPQGAPTSSTWRFVLLR
jgi:hypothetical protein